MLGIELVIRRNRRCDVTELADVAELVDVDLLIGFSLFECRFPKECPLRRGRRSGRSIVKRAF